MMMIINKYLNNTSTLGFSLVSGLILDNIGNLSLTRDKILSDVISELGSRVTVNRTCSSFLVEESVEKVADGSIVDGFACSVFALPQGAVNSRRSNNLPLWSLQDTLGVEEPRGERRVLVRILHQERGNSGQEILLVFSNHFHVFDVLRLLGNKGRLDNVFVTLFRVKFKQIFQKDCDLPRRIPT